MKTVKEVSDMTGISPRTLHYYDQINLLKPSWCNEAGYRYYDDTALERLQQILFFREFDMPLKSIRQILDNPGFDKEKTLKEQRMLLLCKRSRLNNLIGLIDDILKGEKVMNLQVFNKDEMEKMYQAMVANMLDDQKAEICKTYGSLENYHNSFLDKAGDENVQKNYQKLVEWYGSKEKVMDSIESIPSAELMKAMQKRMESIYKKLAKKLADGVTDVHCFEVREIMGEMDFVSKKMYNMDDVSALMLDMAGLYRENEDVRRGFDAAYGDGMSDYFVAAVTDFYCS